jgi:FKBP-type peptidyl-prolyl cis-trans isomerase FklB
MPLSFHRIPFLATIVAACALAVPVHAADKALDEAARMQYALGYQLGKDLVEVESRPQDLQNGIEDGRKGVKPRLTDAEMEAALAALEQRVTSQRQKAQAAANEKALVEGQAYLAQNAKKPGWTTTASGLQYHVMTQGTGKTPTAEDTVTVHYKGTLVDGTEFDSSYKRGQPATFPVAGVIRGWTEALQLMPVGSRFELAIPPDLAYAGQGPMANQVLLFEVELLGVGSASAEKAK